MDVDLKQIMGSMTIDNLLALREQVQEILRKRLKAKQAELDRRLRALAPASPVGSAKKLRRRRLKDAHAANRHRRCQRFRRIINLAKKRISS